MEGSHSTSLPSEGSPPSSATPRKLFDDNADERITERVDEARAFFVLIPAVTLGAKYWEGPWFVLFVTGIALLCYLSAIPFEESNSLQTHKNDIGSWRQFLFSRKASLLVMYVAIWTYLFRAFHSCWMSNVPYDSNESSKGGTIQVNSTERPAASLSTKAEEGDDVLTNETSVTVTLKESISEDEQLPKVSSEGRKQFKCRLDLEVQRRKCISAESELTELKKQVKSMSISHEARLQEAESLQREELSNLKQALDAAREAGSEAETLQEELEMQREKCASAELEMTSLKKQVESINNSHETKLREVEEAHREKWLSWQKAMDAVDEQEIEALRSQLETERSNSKAELAKLKDEVLSSRNLCHEEVMSLKDELKQKRESHDEDISSMQKALEASQGAGAKAEVLEKDLEVQRQKCISAESELTELKKQVKAMSTLHEARLQEAERLHREELSNMKQALDAAREAGVAAKTLQEELEAQREKSVSAELEVTAFKKQVESVNSLHEAKLREFEDSHREKCLSSQEAMVAVHKEEIEALRSQLEMERSNSKAELAKLKDEVLSFKNAGAVVRKKKRHWNPWMMDALVETWNAKGLS